MSKSERILTLHSRRRVGTVFVLLWIGPWTMRAFSAESTDSAAGIREIRSRHLTLYTDVPPGADVDVLPEVFDQAFPQWCAWFGVDEAAGANWHRRGYLMRSRERFAAAGLLPADLPEFLHGYARGDQLWLNDQTSTYYRRHLLLHEGTHSFMDALAGGIGPPWFAEGMAELMATHHWREEKLTLNVFPASRDEFSKWGRIEIVRADYAAGRALSLKKVLALEGRAFLQNEPYGWSWAAIAFFDHNPRYQTRFRALCRRPSKTDVTAELLKTFAADWPQVNEDWQVFIANLDYGYDFARMQIELAVGQPLPATGAQVTIAADRGWQSTRVELQAGKTYTLRARGRYQVARQPRPWFCEPAGVTIHYYRGQPLGILLAAVRANDSPSSAPNGFVKPLVVGSQAAIRPQRDGTLYLRINESAGELADNSGTLEVEIAEQPAPAKGRITAP